MTKIPGWNGIYCMVGKLQLHDPSRKPKYPPTEKNISLDNWNPLGDLKKSACSREFLIDFDN